MFLTVNIQMWQLLMNYVYVIIRIIDYDFLSDCHFTIMHGIGIHYVQYCQAMLEHGVCELAHSFFHLLMQVPFVPYIWSGQVYTVL